MSDDASVKLFEKLNGLLRTNPTRANSKC